MGNYGGLNQDGTQAARGKWQYWGCILEAELIGLLIDWMWGMRERQVSKRAPRLLVMPFTEIEKLRDTMCSCSSAWGN